MTNHDFRKWLGGYLILVQQPTLSAEQLHTIGSHMNLVRAYDGFLTEANQMIFNAVNKAFQYTENGQNLNRSDLLSIWEESEKSSFTL